MTGEPPATEDGDPVVTLDALPDGSLSTATVDSLREGDALDMVVPLVVDETNARTTHLDLVVGDTHYFVGWNPAASQWERILTVVDDGETMTFESAVTVFDDETGEPVVEFDPDEDYEVEELVDYLWAYVEYTYPDADELLNVMEQALDELSEERARGRPVTLTDGTNGSRRRAGRRKRRLPSGTAPLSHRPPGVCRYHWSPSFTTMTHPSRSPPSASVVAVQT